ncbi:monocarboxylate transporter 12-like [Argonauta hians]
MISVLVDGICLSVGVFLNDLIYEFGGTNSETSWVMSALNGSYLIVGPLVSLCANKYGCKATTIGGAVFCCISMFCSSYSNSLGLLIFSFSVCGGIGLGFMYLPAIVMVGYYFDEKRALATGIAVCGSGIGNFLFAPFSEFLLEEYGWRGSIMIMSGLVLNGIIFGSFYHPLKPQKSPEISVVSSSIVTSMTTNEPIIMSEHNNKQPQNLRMKMKRMQELSAETNSVSSRRHRSLDMTGTGKTFLTSAVNSEKNRDPEKDSIVRMTVSHDIFPTDSKMSVNSTSLSPFYRKDVLYRGSLQRLSEKMGSQNINEFISSMIVINEEKKLTFGERISKAFQRYRKLKPSFLLYAVACFFLMLGFFIPYTYLPSVGLQLNFTRNQSALLLSVIGISNTIFRIVIGWISDQKWSNSFMINYAAMIISGICTAMVPFFTNYPLLICYCFVYGLTLAAAISLRSIIMVELLGIENLTIAFGLIVMCQGVSSFFGSPIAGLLSDLTGSFDSAFYLGGAAVFFAGVLCIPLERMSIREKNESQESMSISEVKELQPMITETQK